MASMERRKRRHFTPEYKAQVVEVVRTSGKSVGQVAKELDLTETAVRAWVKQAEIDGRRDPQGPLTSEERAELARLRRELLACPGPGGMAPVSIESGQAHPDLERFASAPSSLFVLR